MSRLASISASPRPRRAPRGPSARREAALVERLAHDRLVDAERLERRAGARGRRASETPPAAVMRRPVARGRAPRSPRGSGRCSVPSRRTSVYCTRDARPSPRPWPPARAASTSVISFQPATATWPSRASIATATASGHRATAACTTSGRDTAAVPKMTRSAPRVAVAHRRPRACGCRRPPRPGSGPPRSPRRSPRAAACRRSPRRGPRGGCARRPRPPSAAPPRPGRRRRPSRRSARPCVRRTTARRGCRSRARRSCASLRAALATRPTHRARSSPPCAGPTSWLFSGWNCTPSTLPAPDDRREVARRSRIEAITTSSAARRSSRSGRSRRARRPRCRRASGAAGARAAGSSPCAAPAGRRRSAARGPGRRPRPRWRPCSSLSSNSSCMPMQMPSSGVPAPTASRSDAARARAASISSIVAPKAPSPGSTSASARRSTSGSPVSTTSAPAWRKPFVTLPRLPMP